MSEQTTLPEIKKLESVLEIAEQHLPKMMIGSQRAVEAMQAIKTITSEEEYEEAEVLMGRVKSAYEKINLMRTDITSPMDEAKKFFMSFERPLGDDKSSEYMRVRGIMANYKQAELDKKKEIEAAAAKKKAYDDHIVDLKAQVLKNLNDMLLDKTKRSDSGSSDFFKASTLDNFDERAEQFMKMKPKLKAEDYVKCFAVHFNTEHIKNTKELDDILIKFKAEETYEAWNEKVINAATPIINEWRGKIPQLKQMQQTKNQEQELPQSKKRKRITRPLVGVQTWNNSLWQPVAILTRRRDSQN